jgi:hypothetical protein
MFNIVSCENFAVQNMESLPGVAIFKSPLPFKMKLMFVMHIGGLVKLVIGGYQDHLSYKNRCPLLAQNLHENGFIFLQI